MLNYVSKNKALKPFLLVCIVIVLVFLMTACAEDETGSDSDLKTSNKKVEERENVGGESSSKTPDLGHFELPNIRQPNRMDNRIHVPPEEWSLENAHIVSPNETIVYESFDSKLEVNVKDAKYDSTVPQSVISSGRLLSGYESYLQDTGEVNLPYVFLLVTLDVKSLVSSDLLDGLFYISQFEMFAGDQIVSRSDTSHSLRVYVDKASGDIVFPENIDQLFHSFKLDTGDSGTLLLGYLVKKEDVALDNLYLTVGDRPSDAVYVSLIDVLTEVTR